MPGGDNTIALLSNIVKRLDIITDTIVKTSDPQSSRLQAESDLINNRTSQTGLNSVGSINHTTSISPDKVTPTNTITASNPTNMSVQDITNFLNSLPDAVKSVSHLGNKEIKRFTKVMNGITESITKFVSNNNIKKLSSASAENIKSTVDTVSTLGSSIKKIAALAPIIPIYNLSLKLLSPGINTLGKIMKKISEFKKISKDTIDGITAINKMISGMAIVVGSVIAMGVAIKLLGVTPIVQGAAVVTAVIAAYSAIALGVLAISGLIDAATDKINTISSFIGRMTIITLTTAAIGALLPKYQNELTAGFTVITGIMLGYLAVATLVLTVSKPMQMSTSALKDISMFMMGCTIVAALTIGIGALTKTLPTKDIIAGFGLLTATLLLGLGVAMLAQLIQQPIQQGTAAFAPIEIFMLTAVSTLALTILIVKMKDALGVEDSAILDTLKMMGYIVVGIGGLAIIAGLVGPSVKMGASALLLCGIISVISVIVLAGIVSLVNYGKSTLGDNWGTQSLKAIGLMGLIVTEFGLLAAAAGLALPVIGPGIIAIGAVELLAVGAIGMTRKIISLQKYMTENSIDSEYIGKTIDTIQVVIQRLVTMVSNISFGSGGGVLGSLKTIGKGAGLSVLMGSITMITNALSSIARLVTPDGKMIRPSRYVRGKLVYGEPVNIVAAAETITSAVTTFIDTLTDHFKDIDGKAMLKTAAITATMGLLIFPISKFVKTLSSFQDAGDGSLRSVSFDKDGKIIYGPVIKVTEVAGTIASAVTTFTDVLTDHFKDIDGKSALKTTAMTATMSLLLLPVSNFVKTLSSFQDAGDGSLRSVSFDKDGKIIYGPVIKVTEVAGIIVSAITTFAGTLFSAENQALWDRMSQGKTLFRKTAAEKSMGILGSIISPVTNFVDTLSKFKAGEDGSITVVNQDGKERSVNLSTVATSIANAVTTFAEKISSITFNKSELKSSKNFAEMLKVSVDPIDKFVNMILKYADSPDGSLPLLDKDGNKVKDIDIAAVSANITSSAQMFAKSISELQGGNTSNASMNLSDMSKYITALTTATSGANEKRLSGFAKTITSNAKSLENFDNVLNNGSKKRIENINSLADAIGSLTEKLTESQDGLNALATIFGDLNEIDPDRIRQTVRELGNIDKNTLSNAKNISAAAASDAGIEDAIKNALESVTITVPDITLRSMENYSTGHPNYNIDDIKARFEIK